ncbi:MAG: DUF1722 domain-containing protein [Spirochaetales bacterium]|nr:DUF1722 domain-containing protein [Spirochaetales bacterium]
MHDDVKPVVVISKCLEHDACRWNGLMINSITIRRMKPHVDFIPVCPEVEIGLGVPRKPIRIVKQQNENRLIQSETGKDISRIMHEFIDVFLARLPAIDGFLLKERSPSCGYRDVKIYPPGQKVSPITTKGSGFFGLTAAERFPNKALETEGRLNNFRLREHFLTRLFTLARFRKITHTKAIRDLIEFHAAHKYLLMAYNQTQLKRLGSLVANHDKKPLQLVISEYGKELIKALSTAPSFKGHINVLLHAFGYFSPRLTAQEKAFFLETLESYRSNRQPLSTCTTLLYSWIVRFSNKYLRTQTYFSPYPHDLTEITDSGKGRNH